MVRGVGWWKVEVKIMSNELARITGAELDKQWLDECRA